MKVKAITEREIALFGFYFSRKKFTDILKEEYRIKYYRFQKERICDIMKITCFRRERRPDDVCAEDAVCVNFKDKIREADAVVIGAGAGLSTSAGFTYMGEHFERYFSDFYKKYGFTDMYSGGFYPYETLEEQIKKMVESQGSLF